jgi:hypothetical protein
MTAILVCCCIPCDDRPAGQPAQHHQPRNLTAQDVLQPHCACMTSKGVLLPTSSSSGQLQTALAPVLCYYG